MGPTVVKLDVVDGQQIRYQFNIMDELPVIQQQ